MKVDDNNTIWDDFDEYGIAGYETMDAAKADMDKQISILSKKPVNIVEIRLIKRINHITHEFNWLWYLLVKRIKPPQSTPSTPIASPKSNLEE